MRDLINLVESNLFESRGLGARRAGEEFVSKQDPDEKIYVNRVSFYPVGRMQYETADELQNQLANVVDADGGEVVMVRSFNASDRAFGVAVFDTINKTKITFIKPFRTVSPDPAQNAWSNQDGIPGYQFNSKAAIKSRSGVMPQDVLDKTKTNNLTPQDIVRQVAAKFGADHTLTHVADMVASGQQFPIKITAVNDIGFAAFTNYFCELLHPIALQLGSTTGNAAEAAAKFLGPQGFTGTTISFGTDKTEGLSDSIILNSTGGRLKVSSKAAVGAQASTKNLLDLSREDPDAKSTKYRAVIDIIEKVVHLGARNAPLALARDHGIISAKDEKVIMDMYKAPLVDMTDVSKLSLSKSLHSLLKDRTPANPNAVNLYYHAVAACAFRVAEYINKQTNFSKLASELLNNGALVQVYTKATDNGDTWTLNGFSAEWPSKTTTGVLFSASKNYYSTGIKGNFTFKILRNGAQDLPDVDVESEVAAADAGTSVPGKRIKKAPPNKAELPDRKKRNTSKGVGREKRQP